MSNPKADNLLLFKSIVDVGSLSSAAKTGDISVSQASKRMAQLEETLGIKLLQRTTRKLLLTPPGEMLYKKLNNIKTQIDEAWQSMLEYSNEPRGNIRISAPYHYGLNHLVNFIRQFNQNHPSINVELELTNTENHESKVTPDISFKSHILAKNQLLASTDLTAKKVNSEKLIYVASKHYLETHDKPQQPEELKRHKCLNISNTIKKEWFFYKNEQSITHHIEKYFESNSFAALLQAATNDMGIAQIPESLLPNNDTLTTLFQDYQTEQLDTYAYYNANQFSSKKVTLFLHDLQNLPKN
jgi:DNA-binding transcriptional LysR family regulator